MTKHQKIVELWDAGERDKAVIAERVGSTVKSVRTSLSLYRRGRCRLPRGRTTVSLTVRVPLALVDEASRRDVPPASLAGRLLAAVAESGIYDAVLDEK